MTHPSAELTYWHSDWLCIGILHTHSDGFGFGGPVISKHNGGVQAQLALLDIGPSGVFTPCAAERIGHYEHCYFSSSFSLSFSPCAYFSPRRALPKVLNFYMQAYFDPNKING